MKPILFNTDMVRAILDNRKTVTRRVVKPRYRGMPLGIVGETLCEALPRKPPFIWGYVPRDPPYRPGDILYARETWQYAYDFDGNDQAIEGTGRYLYAADDNNPPYSYWVMPDGTHRDSMPWRPSIHMPREAARIFLRVTDVRVERLQDITDEQVEAEGVRSKKQEWLKIDFADLWNSTVKPADRALYGWDANPWVWVIEFERCEKPRKDG